MLIVDSQVHVWAPETPDRPYLRKPQREIPLGPDDLEREMAEAGVDRAVLVPPSWEGDRNDVVLGAAQARPGRFRAMARIDQNKPQTQDFIRKWRTQKGLAGLRFTFLNDADRRLLTHREPAWLWPEIEAAEIPVMMLPVGLLELVDRLAQDHPALRLCIDHLGRDPAGPKDDACFADLDTLLALARHQNVTVKASSLPSFSTEPHPYPALHKHVRRVVDAFGPRRVFWGTDLTRLRGTYREAVRMFTEAAWLLEDEKQWIMGRGICEWLGWAVPS